jgi:hypothetical protein
LDTADATANRISSELQEASAIAAALSAYVRGTSNDLEADLLVLDSAIDVEGTEALVHTYMVRIDANGQPRVARLIENVCASVIDYAIPRSEIEKAVRAYQTTGSSANFVRLASEARGLFVDLLKTGEGGEMLLFVLAERMLKLPQILCKMSLKTSGAVHYHGADGVHASMDAATQILSLYWCESKMHGNATTAITECFKSLAPYLLEADSDQAARSRDISLLKAHVDLNDPAVEGVIRAYFDKTDVTSSKVRYCAIALVGFDSHDYPKGGRAIQSEVEAACRASMLELHKHIGKRIAAEKLELFEIQVLCVPFPSVDVFRKRFLEAIGA